MGRILAIDFGRKRCGIAATDPLRIVASGVSTVATAQLISFVQEYRRANGIDFIVVGEPRDMHGNPSESTRFLRPVIARLRAAIPDLPVLSFDERFTSVLAHRAMLDGGLGKMARRDKALVDEISATIILNDFLASRQYQEYKETEQI
ncbi:MAG: Holliday junction resolvase RuvX [Muribaculaceae bacterium]|nr:Holliday junction resolvase RuvX [Muribaculaceae bacterium]